MNLSFRPVALVSLWEPAQLDSRHLVAFMPDQSSKTVYDWQWVSHDPGTPEGREELKNFLELELQGATLVYSPAGATRFIPTTDREKREAMTQARYVLLGNRGAWFCQPFREKIPFSRGSGDVLYDILLIKYVTNRQKAQKLAAMPFRRLLSKLEVIPWDLDREVRDRMRQGRPSWQPLMEAVRVSEPRPDWQLNFERAFEWFLDEQEVELRAREYPFMRDPEGDRSGVVRLRYDRDRDRQRIDRHRTGLFALFAKKASRRPSFGDFFDLNTGDEDESAGSLDYCPDDDGRSHWRERRGKARLVARLDEDLITVEVAHDSAHAIPERGWLRYSDDLGTEFALRRQREASGEFLESKSLMSHLHSPTTIKGFRSRWEDAGKGLLGGADDRVKDMLTSQAFYALHGPPGTGKTTVAAHAVAAFLRAERGARILVSAQSNFALDNLALRILKMVNGLNVLAIRISTTRGEDKVRTELDDYRLENIALRLTKEIEAGCALRLERRTDSVPIRAILGRWKAALETGHLELTDRVRRGANLVFATCSAATRRNVDAVGSFGVYDWVIVEEAAKAWPTELAIPLVRGVRWSLIGDHKQLPAHRRLEVEELLTECADSDDDDLREHGQARADYARIFSLFGSLFEEPEPPAQAPKQASGLSQPPAQAPKQAGGLSRPLGRLNMQFRMREPIAEVVSRAFYADPVKVDGDGLPLGTLKTHEGNEKDSGIVEPAALAGQALVWLDTEGVEGCAAKGCWRNEGEVYLIARLLKAMRPAPLALPAGPDEEPLAILTPYREQIDALRAAGLPAGCEDHVYTLHEFQGREANVVIASLVRDTKRRAGTVQSNLGHTANPELINVLFSRARLLLVVVGNFTHFRDSGVEFWRSVCATVQREGQVLPAGEVLPREEGDA
jgi:RecA/RadA recombinase